MLRLILSCCALLAASTAAAQVQPLFLAPAGPWKADFADDRCILSRPYDSGADSHHLAFLFFPATQRVTARFTTLAKVRDRQAGKARISIDGRLLPQEFSYSLRDGGKGVAVREVAFTNFRTNLADTKKALRIDASQLGLIDVDLGNFSKPMAVIQKCLDGLHQSLGIDAAAARAVVTQPEWNIYPFMDLPKEAYSIDILYWVAADGRVDECRVIESTFAAKTNQRICANVMKKAQLEPARDGAGKPVRAPSMDALRAEIRSEVIRY